MKSLLCLTVLCWAITSIEFHLDRQLSLCCKKNIKAITSFSDGSISIEGMNPDYSNSLAILNGTDFTVKVAQIQTDSTVSRILVTPEGGVYFLNGTKIIQKATINNSNVEFSSYNLYSNMIVTDKYVLVGQSAQVPIIQKMNLQNLNIQTFQFEKRQFQFNSRSCLNDLKNGQLIFGNNYTAYILNNDTLSVQQVLTQTMPFVGTSFRSIASNCRQEGSVILIQGSDGSRYETYRLNQTSKQFQFFKRLYSPTLLALTSPYTATSIYKGNLLYWEEFDSQVLVQSWNKTQYMGAHLLIAVSRSQSMFATIRSAGNNLNIYINNLSGDNQINVDFLAQVKDGIVLQGQFTENDLCLLFIQITQFSESPSLFKLDIASRQITAMKDRDTYTNCLAFLVIKDRIVIFTNQTDESGIQHHLQLRDIKTFSIISELKVEFNVTIDGYRLLGNQYWNSHFILLSHARSSPPVSSLASKFVIQGDRIVMIPLEINNLSFTQSFACHQYLVNYMQYPKITKQIQVYEAFSMSLVKTLINQLNFDTFFANQHLLVTEYKSESGTFIYDFSQDKSNWQQGLFFRQYYFGSFYYNQYMKVLFPKRGIYLICNTGPTGADSPFKVVYDLKKIPIKKWQALPTATVNASIAMVSPSHQSGAWVFIISNRTLYSFDDCHPLAPRTVPYPFDLNKPQLFISVSNKYLLIVYNPQRYSYNKYAIEVRLASKISILVKSIFIDRRQEIQSVDITKDGKIVIHLLNNVLVFDMEPQQNAVSYALSSINHADISNEIIAMFGQSSESFILIVKEFSNSQILLNVSYNSYANIIKLSQLGTRIAVYDSDSKLSVRDIASKEIIFEAVVWGALKINFMNENSLLLHCASNITIFAFKTSKNHQRTLLQVINFTQPITSSDGTLIAALIDATTVNILDSNLNLVAEFIAPSKASIVSISFSPQNELLAITPNGTLFVLSPTPCPATFLNVNSVCQCPTNFTNVTNNCVCKPNYSLEEGQCLCINGFTLDSSGCYCNANASVVGSVCQCKETFVRLDNGCACAKGFSFDGNSCYCNANASVVGSVCSCKDSFELRDDTCLCPDTQSFVNGECISCSLTCSSCEGTGAFDCTSFSSIFYFIIGGASLFVLTLAIFIIYMIKRKRVKQSTLQSNLTDSKDKDSKNQSSLREDLYH